MSLKIKTILNIPDFIYWLGWDYFNPQPKHPRDVWVFNGLPGAGKTISMVEYLEQIRLGKIYNIPVHIGTNFAYKYESFPIKSLDDIIACPSDTVIAIDEISSIWPTGDFKNFPFEMIKYLCQQRKLHKKIITTLQDFDMVNINVRRLANMIIDCSCVQERWIFQKATLPRDFSIMQTHPELLPEEKIMWEDNFVASNNIRELFDTDLVIENFIKSASAKPQINPILFNLLHPTSSAGVEAGA